MTQTTFDIEPTTIDGLFTVKYKVFEDNRGSVMEFYRQSDFTSVGLPSLGERPQVNAPLSVKGAVRGILNLKDAYERYGITGASFFK